jgi:hypothetical protein
MGVVRYLARDTDAYVASVQRHADGFEARTGHRLELRVLASDEYFSNRCAWVRTGRWPSLGLLLRVPAARRVAEMNHRGLSQ